MTEPSIPFRSRCTRCGYGNIDTNNQGCLYGSGGYCPKCQGYLTFAHVEVAPLTPDTPTLPVYAHTATAAMLADVPNATLTDLLEDTVLYPLRHHLEAVALVEEAIERLRR